MSRQYIKTGAVISDCGKYRYTLTRQWPTPGRVRFPETRCVFVMLNPSTADANEDDPTIRRCVDFADRFGYGHLTVVNLFAYRATSPKDLLAVPDEEDPVGPLNKQLVQSVLDDAGLIICGWGTNGDHLGQDETMLGWLEAAVGDDVPITALGTTKDRFPRHPLYLPKTATPDIYLGR